MVKKIYETQTITCDTREEFEQAEIDFKFDGWILSSKLMQADGSIRAQFTRKINPMQQLANKLRNKK